LRIRNIRSFEEAELAFGPGTTLIAGDVGSGKTSLLYAIEMALFGTAEVNAAYLVRHGAGHAEVSVTFLGGGHTYQVGRRFRRLRRKGLETFEAERARFILDGNETAYSATELRQQVIDLLGFPDNPSPQAHSDLWRWAVYVPQERMRDILSARPQDRLETVRKALGVERYRIAAENAQTLATDLRRSATGRRAEAERLRHFDNEFEEGNRAAERLRAERTTAEASWSDRKRRVVELRAARDVAESKVRAADADERELVSLEREVEADEGSLASKLEMRAQREAESARLVAEARSSSAEADQLDERRARLAELDRAGSRLRADVDRLSDRVRDLAEARAVLASATKEEESARQAVERARTAESETKTLLEEALAEGPSKEPPAPTNESIASLDERLDAARKKEATRLQALTQAEGSLAELEELLRAGKCPRCHQTVRPGEFASHRAEAQSLVKTARTALAEEEKERARIEEERRARERYERARDRWLEVEKRRGASRAAHDRAVSGSKEAARSLASAEESVRRASARVNDLLPEEARLAELRAESDTLEADRADHRAAVERSLLAAEERKGVERTVDSLRGEVRRIDIEVDGIRSRLGARARRVAVLRDARRSTGPLRVELERAARALDIGSSELASAQSALAGIDAQLEEAARRVAAAATGRAERAALLQEAAAIDDRAGWVGTTLRSALVVMEQKLLTHAQSMFEREFARYFASLVDDPGLVARTDPAFTPLVMIEGEWTPAEALSGGERTSLALAFRLALAHVVRSLGSLHLDTILLDEPTDGFSPEQVLRMGELLEELALPQVILVSHESELAAVADRVVRVQKVDGKSTLETRVPGDSESPGGGETPAPPAGPP
jgi:exonuclease SbcC